MRVAIVNGSIRHGGAEHFTVTLANALAEDCINKVHLITQEKKSGEYFLDDKVQRECLMGEKPSFIGLIKDAKRIAGFSNKNNLDVVIGIGIYANECVCLAKFFSQAKILISERNDPKHDRISWKNRLLRWILYRKADGMVFQTQGAKKFYSKKIQNKSVVIHNPVISDLPSRDYNCKKEIVAVGRLAPQKNYPLMLQAFQKVHEKHPEYILRIFGQGPEKEKLEQLAVNLKIENVVSFEGFCLDVHEHIKKSDIFVMSSDFEGMPNALMEAMAMGFPVVSTDCPSGGPKELIQNKKNGILVPVQDSQSMADEIIYLIEHIDQKELLGENAMKIRETHSIEMIRNEWLEFMKGQKT